MTLDEKQKQHVVSYNKYIEAIRSGYQGSFEQFEEEMSKSRENLKVMNSPSKTLFPKLEEQEKSPEQKKNYGLYEEARLSGFKGSFDEFMEHQRKADTQRPLKEAIKRAASELAEKVSPYFNHVEQQLSEEVVKKSQLKQYHKDIQEGLFEGSFYEWLLLKQHEREKIEEQEKQKIKRLSG
jgi:hypothetical protein